MEFGFSAAEQAFRQEVRQFLHDHPPAQFPQAGMDAGYGSGEHSHAFLKAMAQQGWLTMTWP